MPDPDIPIHVQVGQIKRTKSGLAEFGNFRKKRAPPDEKYRFGQQVQIHHGFLNLAIQRRVTQRVSDVLAHVAQGPRTDSDGMDASFLKRWGTARHSASAQCYTWPSKKKNPVRAFRCGTHPSMIIAITIYKFLKKVPSR